MPVKAYKVKKGVRLLPLTVILRRNPPVRGSDWYIESRHDESVDTIADWCFLESDVLPFDGVSIYVKLPDNSPFGNAFAVSKSQIEEVVDEPL